METKKCFKCGKKKSRDSFYVHIGMSDGLLSKCKDCTRKDVVANRAANPEKYKAYVFLINALRDGRAEKKPCKKCGEVKVRAYCKDYSKPLKVEWFCLEHLKLRKLRARKLKGAQA